MFKKNEFMEYLQETFTLDGTTQHLIINCIDFANKYFKDDFINKLHELLEYSFDIRLDEIEQFYN